MTKNQNEASEQFKLHVEHLVKAISLCIDRKLFIPGLILLYAGIDSMSWLCRPVEKNNVTRSDFIKWVEDYLLPGADLPCKAMDLYGARCALLHSHIAESDLSRAGSAREIFYLTGEPGEVLFHLKLSTPTLPLNIEVDKLITGFRQAVERFQKALSKQPELAELVYDRIEHHFCYARYLI